MADTEVVVAGGGPVGLMLACELRLAGVRTVLLERLVAPSGQSRAFRLQPRTLELFDQRGILDRVKEGNKTWDKAHFAGIRPLLDLGVLDTAHPYALLIPQARTERILEARALELGVEIRRGHSVTGVDQDSVGVTVTVDDGTGPYRLTADWLAGCDGGRSAVRKLAGIAFPGTEPTASALLGDVAVPPEGSLPFSLPATVRTPAGLLMAVSLEEGVLRVVTTEYGREVARNDEPLTLDELSAAVTRITGKHIPLRQPRWLSRFNDSTRLAETYRRGRVFLAGDAAHIHLPIGAQGLNLGLLDAANLGWKLGAQVRGWAPDGLLDSYDAERRSVAEQVLEETRAQTALMNPDPRLDPLRDFFGGLLRLPAANRHVSGIVTGLAFGHDLGGGGEEHPLLGGRAPELSWPAPAGERVRLAHLLRKGRGVLVDLAGRPELTTAAAPWSDVVEMAAATGGAVDGIDALLVRPDGCVAWVAATGGKPVRDAEGLVTALERWFGTGT